MHPDVGGKLGDSGFPTTRKNFQCVQRAVDRLHATIAGLRRSVAHDATILREAHRVAHWATSCAMCVQGVAVGHHFARRIRTWCPRSCSCCRQQDDEPAGKSRSSRPPRRSAVRQFPDDRKRRGDRRRAGRARRRAVAAVAGFRADDLRAGARCSAASGRALVGRSGVWPTMHTNTSRVMTAFSDLEPDRPGLPVEPRHPRLPASLRRDIRPHLAHPVRHPGRAARRGRRPMAGRPLRRHRAVSTESWSPAAGFIPPPSRPCPGLDTFAGDAGAISTYHFRGPARISAGVSWWPAARSARSRSPPNSPTSAPLASW